MRTDKSGSYYVVYDFVHKFARTPEVCTAMYYRQQGFCLRSSKLNIYEVYYLSALLEPWSFMIGADGEFTTITISLKDIFTSIVRRVGIRH